MQKRAEVALFVITLLWTIWLIVKTFETQCFNMIDSYATIILLYIQVIANSKILNKR